MKYTVLAAIANAVKISEGGLLTCESTNRAEVTKMVLNENEDFVGYLIQEGAETPDSAQNLAEVESKYRFDSEGKVVGTSFLSLDLLTIAKVLGISNGKTWGTSDNDTDIYTFMRELRA